jgi:hypothetical protein
VHALSFRAITAGGRCGYCAAAWKTTATRLTEIRSPSHILLAITGGSRPGRETELEGVTAGVPRPPYDVLPVLPALAPLLPGKGLAKGTVVAAGRAGTLCVALMAGASQAGMWCSVAGMPHLGIVAAAEAGVKPGRMMLVPEPGPRWAGVAATMLDACEVVLLRPPGRVPAQVRRRLETAARRSGAALIVAGTWDGAPVRLHVAWQQWDGIGDGYGRLRARRAEVVAEGRGALVRPRRAWLWLPGPDGSIIAAAGPADSRNWGTGEGGWRRTGSG